MVQAGAAKRRDSAPADDRAMGPKRRRSSVVRYDPYATPRITRSLSKKPENGEDEPTGVSFLAVFSKC